MNGDLGLTVLDTRQQLRVIFAQAGVVRWISPLRLPDVDTVFAMAVYKSQGSEFTHAALILPNHPSPLLTRELAYTAITRAKAEFTLLGAKAGRRREGRVGRGWQGCSTYQLVRKNEPTTVSTTQGMALAWLRVFFSR